MSTYVQQGVFPIDPFHMLTRAGVESCFQLGAARGRAAQTWDYRYRSAESTGGKTPNR